MSRKAKPTIFVAMSGGVDSSVAAALLKQAGFDVVGVFMKNWTQSPSAVRPRAHGREEVEGSQNFCTAEADFADVRAVCQRLGIPYYTFNFEKEYKKKVLDYFFAEYKAGRTPNPDVMCNKEIKFDLFLKKCLALGADFIATGHYAQRVTGNALGVMGEKSKKARSHNAQLTTHYTLLKGNDPIKDQTYFLHNLTQEQLAKTLFPVGKYSKKQARALARKFNLPTAEKKDSQGICFIGPIDVRTFLKTVIKTKTGKIVNQEGKVLGAHEGAWFYTIGQRRVEGLAGQPHPLYVIGTDIKKNLVIVGPDSATYGKGVILENLHLIGGVSSVEYRVSSGGQTKRPSSRNSQLITRNYLLTAKPRYGPDVYPGELMRKNNRWQFIFDKPERALTPGQSLVIYDQKTCLGGGVIDKVTK